MARYGCGKDFCTNSDSPSFCTDLNLHYIYTSILDGLQALLTYHYFILVS